MILFLCLLGRLNFPESLRVILHLDGFIVDLLKNDTSESEIINALLEKFDAPEDIITANVHETISKLQEINALEF